MTSIEILYLISSTAGTTFWGWYIIWEVEQRRKEAQAGRGK